MRIRQESPAEIVFVGHSPGVGLATMLFAIGVYLLGERAEGTPASIAKGMGLLFAAAGLAAVFRRDSFRLDLVKRRWRRNRGFWPLTKTTDGSFDTLQRIEVVKDPGYRRGRPSVEWEVWLRSSHDAASIRLLETADEPTARRFQERFEKRLGLASTVDRRG